jgi:replicative DNA helicase
MGAESLVERLLAAEARVDSTRLRSGRLDYSDWVNLTNARLRVADYPLWIDDTAAPTLYEVRAKARRWRQDKTAGGSHPESKAIVALDYLQLMGQRGQTENREREVAGNSRGMKALSKLLHCPMIVLSQLNRAVESRSDKRPMLSDLRDSGALEQDADVVTFVYRDEVYNDKSPDRGTAEIIIAKQRNGDTGTTKLAFIREFSRFENLSERRPDGAPPPDDDDAAVH